MRDKIKTTALVVAGLAALTGSTGVADAAKHRAKHTVKKHQTSTTTSSSSSSSSGGNPKETPLTGDTKTSAEAAALAAVPGGTVRRSSTEDPSDPSGAAYEVHVTKADGSAVEVLEDSSFTVLSTTAEQGHGGGGHCNGGGHGNPNETPLTGDTKTSAENAALAAVPGGTVRGSSTEDPSDPSGAAYEVHVTKADGSAVEVLEDSSFTVIKTQADDHARPADDSTSTGASQTNSRRNGRARV